MLAEDFQALKDSIDVSGLREPIVLFEGMILDGWHRYCACMELGAPADFQEFEETDPVQFVQDKHTRRPLTLTQRMTAIALMHAWLPRGKPSKSALNADLTAAQLAKAAGGSIRTAEQVKEAITKGSSALVKGMKSGKTSAVKAAAVSKLPKHQQAAAIDKPLAKQKSEKFTPPANNHADELAESARAISQLSEEVELLEAKLAVKHMDATGEEKSQAATLIADLRAQVKTLNTELDAMRTSRDGLQRENRELMKQIAIYQRQLKQAQKV
jgi:hypothetical protein